MMNTKHKSELYRLGELLIIVAASTAPLFVLANEIDDDEFWKSSASVGIAATAGVVAAAYRLWRGGNDCDKS